jgi:hypothetical protein
MAKVVVLTLGLLLLLGFTSPVLADPDSVKWSNVNTPTQGKPGGWVLASGSDIQHLTMASNGTLYAYGAGLTYTLYQSTDGGYSWLAIGKVQDEIVDIAIAPDNVVYYATSSQIFKSVDGAHTTLITYIDSLAQPPILVSPTDEASGLGTIVNYTVKNISLDWETLEGATEYHWQLDYDNEFSSVPTGFEGDTRASTAQLPDLDPTTTYYWRVRATEPVLSLWSDKWSFTTSFGTEAYAPELESPQPGATGVPLKPIFQWSAVAGANGYELVVSTHSAVDNPTILKTGTFLLPNTAWEANVELDYDTTYYWKVRTVSADTYSPWRAVSAFTTKSASDPTTQSILPPSLDAFNWTDWVVPAGGIMFLIFLIIMMMMLIAMIILVVKVTKL